MSDMREYRGFDARSFDAKQEEGGALVLEGYATTFGEPYELRCGLMEVVDRHALEGADLSDVILQFDHAGPVMARGRNGTLALMVDDHGLFVRADVSGCAAGRELHESVRNGLVDRMSFGFTVAEDGWEYDPQTNTSTIKRISKVYDVSAVSMPANDGTEIQARSYLHGAMEAARLEESRCRQEERARVALALDIHR